MAHLIDFSKGFAAFTRRANSEPAWHRLGGETPADAPLEEWQRNGGMLYTIEKSAVNYSVPDALGGSASQLFPDRVALYRSDTFAPLAIVSSDYNVVQPSEILEFFRNLIDTMGFVMETCGVLKGGKVYWALAKTPYNFAVKGLDQINGYVLLMTSCDTNMATVAKFTKVRVVCNNTLQVALARGEEFRVPHSRVWNPNEAQRYLGLLDETWEETTQKATLLADRKVTDDEVRQFLIDVLGAPEKPLTEQPNVRGMQIIYQLFQGKAIGSELPTADGTAWGLVNAVTEYQDHIVRARNPSSRLASAWAGDGAKIKAKAWDAALRLAA